MERVLITGVGGFIGSALAERFLNEGFEVVGMDNFDSYYPQEYKRLRLQRLLEFRNFEFIFGDFTQDETFERIPDDVGGILHIGAKAGVRASIKDPESYIRVNVLGTLKILNFMLERRMNKILMASTSSIYAGHNPPFVEDMKTDTPISPYATSKKCAENLLYTYHHLYGIDAWILRYFTVYGPQGRPDMSVFKMMYSAFSGEEFTIFGDGSQKRSFTFIDDVVDGTYRAYRNIKGFEVINLGNDEDELLLELISKVERITERKVNIVFKPFNRADILETKANIDKARRILGWGPKVDVDEGLKKTYLWFEENWEKIHKIFPRLPEI